MVVRRHEGGFFKTVWGTWDDFWQETNIAGTLGIERLCFTFHECLLGNQKSR